MIFLKIHEINSFEKYEDFINELAESLLYSDPHFAYCKDNLYHSLKKKDQHAFAVSYNGTTEGLFVWLIIPDNQYIEMIIGFTKKKKCLMKCFHIWRESIAVIVYILYLIH